MSVLSEVGFKSYLLHVRNKPVLLTAYVWDLLGTCPQ
jgi:hypothetical protein